MASGHIVAGQCVDVADSANLTWSLVNPELFTNGADSFLISLNFDGTNWFIRTDKNGAFFSSVATPSLGFPACDTAAQFFDGFLLGWGVVAAMVIAWSIHILRRAI